MIEMKTIKTITFGFVAAVAACFIGTGKAQAQEFTAQADLVSSYIWRGFNQGGGVHIQPTLGFSAGNFTLTAWGSTNFGGENKEIDLTAAYKFGEAGPTLSVASLWWANEGKYFNFESHETDHHFEAGLSYTLPCESFPLSIAWNLMFAGSDKRVNSKGEVKQNFSSYVELNYPFSVKSVDLNATVGMLPYGQGYNNNGTSVYTDSRRLNKFAVTNIALKAIKEIRITDKFSLPIFTQAIWNPAIEDAYLVFGITLRP